MENKTYLMFKDTTTDEVMALAVFNSEEDAVRICKSMNVKHSEDGMVFGITDSPKTWEGQ